MLGYDTQAVTVTVDPDRVLDFIKEGSNLPKWAIGFAKSVERVGDRWLVTTGSGARVPTAIHAHADTGTVDFVMSPAPGVTVTAWSRVVPVEEGTLFSFAQAQSPDMPDDLFAAQVRAVSNELVALKALLEVECPL